MKISVLDCVKNKQFLPTGEPDKRTDGIEYKFNSLGYRTKEFDSIDWANSIVVFGGSDVLGEGIEESETLVGKLHAKTGLFTVNMGIGGASIQRVHNDSVLVAANYPTPKAIVVLWPIHYRATNYTESKVVNNGPWNWDEPGNFLKAWIHEKGTNAIAAGLFNYMANKQVWRNTKSYYASFFEPTAKALNVTSLQIIDKGKDNIHPGIQSMESAANLIIKELSL
jgi:hypothetical protein